MEILLKILCVGLAVIPMSCFVNLAQMPKYRGQASQSSTYPGEPWTADKAVDGHLQHDDDQSTCSFTKDWTSITAWWKFSLRKKANVAYLEIYFRNRTVNVHVGFSVFVFDDPRFIPTSSSPNKVFTQGSSPCPTRVLNVTVNKATRGIALFNTKKPPVVTNCEGYKQDHRYSTIETCEVNIMGCPYGYFGENCSQCGLCQNGSCDVFNGSCIQGCSTHVMDPPLCIHCKKRFYGKNCREICGKCRTRTHCDDVTGTCPAGCQDHWSGPKCDVCQDGFYGSGCTLSCGHCRNGSHCDKTTGICTEGCQGNWSGTKCDVCGKGFYGKDCNRACGKCEQDYCDKDTGVCPNGCQRRWNGSRCNECVAGFFGVSCENPCGHCVQTTCTQESGHCLRGCQENWEGARCDARLMTSEPNTGAIGGGLFATLFALVGIIMLIVLLRYRNVRKRQRSTRSELNAGVTSELNSNHIQEGRRRDTSGNSPGAPSNVQIPNVDVSLECGYYNLAYRGTDIVIDELQGCIATKTTGQNNIFLAEYKKLPPKDVRACCEAQKTENLDKNRFKSTLPYDHSRVVLKQRWSASDNDYINANYIKDTNGEKRYIATQGPRENTVEDFWRLIWQERVKDIVMLTNLVETGKKKCAKYWPDKDKHLSMGRCRVYLSDETIYAFHVVRKLTVERVDLTQRRTITQFHYTAWPDHDIPEELGLIQFHRYVSTRYRPGPPLLVHCSAGVGRSGTYIGLDSLLIQGKEKGRINVFEFVKQMRQDRMIMVQTPEQYVFLHRALHYGFQAKNTVISEHDLPAKAKSLLDDSSPLNLQSLYNEYQFLETLIPVYKSEEKDLARTLENRDKNVDMEILPVSKFRPYLTTYVKGRNEYINAVIVPSFTNPTAFIITQKPLPDTEVDLWRLCMDHEVNVLVVLEEKIQENKWLPTKGLSRKCPPFIITAGNKETHTGGIILDSLQVTQDGDKKNLKVFQVPSRNEDALLKATELLLDREKTSILTTIVMSKNGAGPAGLFCVLHNALQQLRMDGEVDIFTAVKQIQTRRPEIITKLEEYQQCYKLVARPASSGGIYANL